MRQTGDGAGILEARIKDNQLYILHSEKNLPPELLDSQTATLHQLHRALLTSPSPLPNTTLALSITDHPMGASVAYSRPAYALPNANHPPITRAFLMPHFSFWAWPSPLIGSMARAAAAVEAIEAGMGFAEKDPRVVWRGTVGYRAKLREELVRVAGGRAWADVEGMEGGGMAVEGFCRYKYVIYTEGVTYSGRLQFLQMCRSVLIAPPFAWLQHTTHLVRPVFAVDLGVGGRVPVEDGGVKEAWPTRYAPEEANAVFVSSDWSDLEATIRWLEEHPEVAEGIATRQRELFVGGGYFSPAAETCYWRALIRGWSSVVTEAPLAGDEQQAVGKETRWEEFALGNRIV
ncbi:hypothetical protein B0T25DRAFT_481745 [Lasiosphaeria hispida]|uniref:Glycosyl transferase CAP10 domain-containing protein n=1 Tax=Lasiosphaeria hispida TaxID=260671 RepID=A0AAJ0MC52_9PEZI|nr:hypothetical protein B0T25DRAFT_481745 [Lasiosphaeria hispida]